MPRRIVVLGATGYTGRLVVERLVAAGAAPVIAGRSTERLERLRAAVGADLEVARADVLRRNSVFEVVQPGDVLVTTVGPFVKWGDAAARAAIEAGEGTVYMDSTGEPQFIRRVFETYGGAARQAGVPMLTAMGFDWVPGQLAGALALREGGDAAVRVDVGYYSLGAGGSAASQGTKASLVGAALEPGFAYRGGRIVGERPAARVRSFRVKGRERPALSVASSEHFTLPPTHPGLREVNVYLGWAGPLTRAVQAGSAVTSLTARLPGARSVLRAAGERLASLTGSPDEGTTPGGISWVAAIAYSPDGDPLAEVHLSGVDPYEFTGRFLSWAARRAAEDGVEGVGAVGPVAGFGLEALEAGCAESGLTRVAA